MWALIEGPSRHRIEKLAEENGTARAILLSEWNGLSDWLMVGLNWHVRCIIKLGAVQEQFAELVERDLDSLVRLAPPGANAAPREWSGDPPVLVVPWRRDLGQDSLHAIGYSSPQCKVGSQHFGKYSYTLVKFLLVPSCETDEQALQVGVDTMPGQGASNDTGSSQTR